MLYRIEIKDKAGIFDAVGAGIKKDILDLGIDSVRSVRFAQVYNIEGNISDDEIKTICEELLTDKISQDYYIIQESNSVVILSPKGAKNLKLLDPSGFALRMTESRVEVAYNIGVMDPVEASVLKGIKDLGIDGVNSVKTAKEYLLTGKISPAELKTISEKLLYNKLIQHIVIPPVILSPEGAKNLKSLDPSASPQDDKEKLALRHRPEGRMPEGMTEEIGYKFNLVTVDLLKASDEQLKKISQKGQLFLSLTEMRAIKKYFQAAKRNPTDCELETIAQTWSEHC